MKRLAAVFLFSVFFAASAHAQLGVKAGLNAAVLQGTVGTDATYQTSYHAGIFYEMKVIDPILSIQPELLYSLQGTERKSDLVNYRSKLHYLNLPVLAKVTLGPVYAEAGPQVGFLLKAREDGVMVVSQEGNGEVQIASNDRSSWNDYKKLDLGFAVGAGVKLPLGFALGARFNAGMNDINKVKSVQGVNDPQLKNRVFQVYASFQLPGD
ncbi:porin family protein [Hymenobacter chitinivorans]|uniref:Outer membrane protein with beta-barrel domain n=1 Tax=Hymenobacter chitinivorans DSM 11115 TaxID=1121954 RepID=A0A2M9ASG6_9BACT|nr:porin family protein [Hymenobacter chitinivorans]PJJ48573.1 outer membrane protein with beta-barrel domain [Hymenobacter chitinivorans DSM 11115]